MKISKFSRFLGSSKICLLQGFVLNKLLRFALTIEKKGNLICESTLNRFVYVMIRMKIIDFVSTII
jgi:hypothetical protein